MASFYSSLSFFFVFVVLTVSQISTAQNVDYCEQGAPVFGPGSGCYGCSERCMGYYGGNSLGSYCHTNLEKIDYCICCIPYPEEDYVPFEPTVPPMEAQTPPVPPTVPPTEAETPTVAPTVAPIEAAETPMVAPTPMEAHKPLEPTPSPAAPFGVELAPETAPCVQPVAPPQIAPSVSPAAAPVAPQTSISRTRRPKKKKHPKFSHVAPSVAPVTSQASTKSKKPIRE